MTSRNPSFVKACVIGHPIAHSKSPMIHNDWIVRYGLQGQYGAVDIAPETLAQQTADLIEQGYAGFNVTIPHKQEIFKLCKSVDETARAIGAVNTVTVVNGDLHGTNTDAFGFIENLRQTLPDFDLTKGPAVILGAGGAARAIVHGLISGGAKEIILCNRTRDKAEELVAMNPGILKVAGWEERSKILKNCNLLVNSTALGMKGKDPLDISLMELPLDAAVYDIVYAPLMTPLLQDAKERGNSIVTGIGMLLHQARPAFEKWFGILPDVDQALETKVLG